MAHLSNRPFGQRGMWGSAWRRNREFVGKVAYGVRWKLWSPEVHCQFPFGFRRAVMTMIMASRRPESVMYLLHDYIVFFIMNKCWWDWWGDEIEQIEFPAASASAAATARQPSCPRHDTKPLAESAPFRHPDSRCDQASQTASRPVDLHVRRCPRIALLPSTAEGSCAARILGDNEAPAAASLASSMGSVVAETSPAEAMHVERGRSVIDGSSDGAWALRTSGEVASVSESAAMAKEPARAGANQAIAEIRNGACGGFREIDDSAGQQRRERREAELRHMQSRREARKRCIDCRRFACICCN